MAFDGEKMFRAALDEPVPPDPPEIEAEGGDGGHHHLWPFPLVQIWVDGSVTAIGIVGMAILGWIALATLVTLWLVVDWVLANGPGLVYWTVGIFVSTLLFGVGQAIWQWLRRRKQAGNECE